MATRKFERQICCFEKHIAPITCVREQQASTSSVDQSCSEFRTGWYGAEYASTGVEMEQEISSEQILRGGAPISDL